MSVEAFGIEKEFLLDLLKEVEKGASQLPEFQRGWVWPDRNIASLLASISLGYPVGTIMMLKAGGEVRFKQRPVQGAHPSTGAVVDRLILDGQQRLTSLYQSLRMGTAVTTVDLRKNDVTGWFYFDIRAAVDSDVDREETIRLIPEDKIIRNFRREPMLDLSTPAKEYEQMMFPASMIFDPVDWYMGFQEYWNYNRDQILLWNAFQVGVIKRFEQYQIPVIELGKGTAREVVCQVFEKVNTGGVTLTVFELLTATFAADEFDLREDWELRQAAWADPQYGVLGEVSNTDFLQAVTLLATQSRQRAFLARADRDEERAPRVGCRRTDMLALTLAEYQQFAPQVVQGFKTAAKFLYGQHIFTTPFLPYGTQLIPLAAILAMAGNKAEPLAAQAKLTQWFWCGVLGELYGGTTETRFGRDLPEVLAWINGSTVEPRTVEEAQFAAGRLQTLRTRGSAAYKGLYALLLKDGAMDWRTGDALSANTYFDEAIDIHHIFPKKWCDEQGISPSVYNSIVNKTPLSARTNRIIGGRAPSEYLHRLANSAGVSIEKVKEKVTTHRADVDRLVADDFDGFQELRRAALLNQIAAAMGKPVTADTEAIGVQASSGSSV